MAASSAREGLYQRIENARTRSVSSKYFIQPSTVKEIFTHERVEAILADIACDDHDRIGLHAHIQHQGIITLAILVWHGRVDAIVAFRNADCLDSRLPIDEETAVGIVPEFGRSFAREYQWEFLPYIFRKDMALNHRTIPYPNTVFPIVEEEILGEGGFGIVTRLSIPSSMQEFFPSAGTYVSSIIRKSLKKSRKQSKQSYDQIFTNEMKCLRLLNRLAHPNIVPLLGSYTFDGGHNFLFPYFDMDVRTLFTLEQRPAEFVEDFTLYLALAGLASALEHTHEFHIHKDEHGIDLNALGYHHDISPSNILVSRERSTLLLSDFGLGKLQADKQDSKTVWKKGGGDYLAPECVGKEWERLSVGRSVDIWAFGCLIAELATYMTRGPRGIQQFRELRMEEFQSGWETTYFFNAERLLKPSIRSWLEALSISSTTTMQHFFKLTVDVLEPSPELRPQITPLRRRLDAIATRSLFQSVQSAVSEYIKHVMAESLQPAFGMQLLFYKDRLDALSYALPSESSSDDSVLDDPRICRTWCQIMSEILGTARARLKARHREAPDDNAELTESELGPIIEKAWNLLPVSVARKAQAMWLHSLHGGDLERLENLQIQSDIHRPRQYHDVTAAAHMRAIRLRMLNDTTIGAKQFLFAWNELDSFITHGSHTYARFRGHTPVLVEFSYYRPEWTRIPEDQRLLIMDYKARDFSVDPKPAGLRILKCVGFVELPPEQGWDHGYAFLYELPRLVEENRYPVTLQDLLVRSTDRVDGAQSQAPLLGRLKLAYALALFFFELSTVGFLHESFATSNVIFSEKAETLFGSPTAWSNPFVVGFERCRPDGQFWSTDGPSDHTSILNYEHPLYRETKRFTLEYDYYSLGLVLLEIGLWYPLQLWSRKYKSLAPRDFRDLLIAKYVPRLSVATGEIYRDVVRSCLDGTLERDRSPATASTIEAEIFGQYISRVVDPLEKLAHLQV